MHVSIFCLLFEVPLGYFMLFKRCCWHIGLRLAIFKHRPLLNRVLMDPQFTSNYHYSISNKKMNKFVIELSNERKRKKERSYYFYFLYLLLWELEQIEMRLHGTGSAGIPKKKNHQNNKTKPFKVLFIWCILTYRFYSSLIF